MNASTFTARVIASTGADVAACISGAIGAMSGPLHGGAPARVLPMIEEVERTGDATAVVKGVLDRGDRLMGFGHRVYRAEDPRARVLRRTCKELGAARYEAAAALEQAALEELRERRPDRAIETNVEFWAAVILDFAEVPAHMMPAMFTCARTGGWCAHIMEQKRLGKLVRPSARYVGPGPAPPRGRRGLGHDRAPLSGVEPCAPWSSSPPAWRPRSRTMGARVSPAIGVARSGAVDVDAARLRQPARRQRPGRGDARDRRRARRAGRATPVIVAASGGGRRHGRSSAGEIVRGRTRLRASSGRTSPCGAGSTSTPSSAHAAATRSAGARARTPRRRGTRCRSGPTPARRSSPTSGRAAVRRR